MKQSDIAMIILVVAFSMLLSYFLGGLVLNSPDSRSKQVEVVQPISERFVNIKDGPDGPYAKIFNDSAINPAENINIGESETDEPFVDSEN